MFWHLAGTHAVWRADVLGRRAYLRCNARRSAPVPGRSNARKTSGLRFNQASPRTQVAAPEDGRAPHCLVPTKPSSEVFGSGSIERLDHWP